MQELVQVALDVLCRGVAWWESLVAQVVNNTVQHVIRYRLQPHELVGHPDREYSMRMSVRCQSIPKPPSLPVEPDWTAEVVFDNISSRTPTMESGCTSTGAVHVPTVENNA